MKSRSAVALELVASAPQGAVADPAYEESTSAPASDEIEEPVLFRM